MRRPTLHLLRGTYGDWAITACGKAIKADTWYGGAKFCRACTRSVLAKDWAKAVASL